MSLEALSAAGGESSETIMQLTADLVASHVSNNKVAAEELPSLIRGVYSTLASIEGQAGEQGKPEPTVPIKKSVHPDYIVCLEDGRKLKMLKRHLRTAYNMSPEDYRARWNLPSDYPMVAPNYAKKRSNLAKKIGLGRKRS
jgi:predicted transcriptional regulator